MSHNFRRLCALAPLVLFITAVSAHAAEHVVTSVFDDNTPGSGSLRSLIAAADAGDTITFHPDLAGNSFGLDLGPLVITKNLTIVGLGFQNILIYGPGLAQGRTPMRIFVINESVVATIKDLSISGGVATADLFGQGGGIYNGGELTLERVTLYDNRAEYGAGIYSAGPITIRESEINSNIASNSGGALYVGNASPAEISDSTFHGNYATNDGGAILNWGVMNIERCNILSNLAATGHGGGIANNFQMTVSRSWFGSNAADTGGGISGVLALGTTINRSGFVGNSARNGGGLAGVTTHTHVTNSTFSRNTATGASFGEGGGGIWFSLGTMTLSNVTLHDNGLDPSVESGIGGGIVNDAGTLNIKNSILSRGADLGDNVENLGGTVNVAGVNFADDASAAFTVVTAADLAFNALDFSALPPFLPLAATSVAIDAATDGTDWLGADLDVDQRGITRPQGLRFDVGAYEFNFFDTIAPQISFGSPSPAPNAAGWNNTSVSIPFEVTDEGGSGLASVSPASSPLLFDTEGAAQFQEVTASDAAGNSVGLGSPSVSIDMTSPASSHSITRSTVTLSASDNLSGVRAIFYDIDGGAPRIYTGPFALSGTMVHYWSEDRADNTESAHTIDNRLAATVAVANVNGQRGKSVTISATVSAGRTKVSNLLVSFSVPVLGYTGTATTNSKGVASVSVVIPATTPMGMHVISASVPESNRNLAGSGSGTLAIKR